LLPLLLALSVSCTAQPPPRSSLLPYTTLFRSSVGDFNFKLLFFQPHERCHHCVFSRRNISDHKAAVAVCNGSPRCSFEAHIYKGRRFVIGSFNSPFNHATLRQCRVKC